MLTRDRGPSSTRRSCPGAYERADRARLVPPAAVFFGTPCRDGTKGLNLGRAAKLLSRRWTGLALGCCLVSTLSCGWRSKYEKWIIPQDYVGWLRLDYAVSGAAPLSLEDGFYLVKMPPSGRLQTSSPYSPSTDENEFFGSTIHGLQKLTFSEKYVPPGTPTTQEVAVQKAFSFFKLVSGTRKEPGKCIFIGTYAESKANHQDCQAWLWGQPKPPIFRRQSVP